MLFASSDCFFTFLYFSVVLLISLSFAISESFSLLILELLFFVVVLTGLVSVC